jgi:hypothetical protein
MEPRRMRAACHASALPRENEKHAAAHARASGPDRRMIATAPTPGGVAMAAMVSEKPSVDVAIVARIVVADGAIGVAGPLDFRFGASPTCRRSPVHIALANIALADIVLANVALANIAISDIALAAVAVVAGARNAAGSSCQDDDAPVKASSGALRLDVAVCR